MARGSCARSRVNWQADQKNGGEWFSVFAPTAPASTLQCASASASSLFRVNKPSERNHLDTFNV